MLMFTEPHCATARRTTINGGTVNAVPDAVTLVDVERDDLLRAATSSWRLRSADTIHLATALWLEADTLTAYTSSCWRQLAVPVQACCHPKL
jgi:uncharacterized protein